MTDRFGGKYRRVGRVYVRDDPLLDPGRSRRNFRQLDPEKIKSNHVKLISGLGFISIGVRGGLRSTDENSD